MLTFCTLFDSNYLDKGLVLYDSMRKVMEDFRLYVLAMDDKCSYVLQTLQLKNVTVISLTEFADEELKRIQKQRSRAEFCWTCTASLLDYVFETYKESFCTYVDADVCFYQNPEILIQEMVDAGKSVQIVEHGFGTGRRAKIQEKNSGRFCVEFNTFRNDALGREVLSEWKQQTRAHCSMQINEMGDQKYLTDWPEKYSQIHILKNLGGGIAPWNIARFKASEQKNAVIEKRTGRTYEMIFYHFHHLEYLENRIVDMNVFKSAFSVNAELVRVIYMPYLRALEEKKEMLSEKFGILPLIESHPGLIRQTRKEKIYSLNLKNMGEMYNKLVEKLIYLHGKKKDLICLNDIC